MHQDDIKFIYEIDSSLDLDEILEELHKELKLEKGILEYFSLSEDDYIEEVLPIDELKQKALEKFSDDEYPILVFPNVEVFVDEDEIEIVSKIDLKLENVKVDKIIVK